MDTGPRSASRRRGTVSTDGHTAVDARGRLVTGDPAVFARLGLDPAADAVRLPAQDRVGWEPTEAGDLVRIGPRSGPLWPVDVFTPGSAPVARSTLSAEHLAAFTRTVDFGENLKSLAGAFAAASGMTVPIVVLIDPSGAPTFAGGTTQDSRQLAAMEQCRRASAPMAIWQAFEEERLTVDAHWIETVLTDDRFEPIRRLLPPVMEEEGLVYVTVPLRSDRAVIGVVAGFWPASEPITAERVACWLSCADDLALGLQFSELLRRAHLQGAEAERVRINDDIHAGLAQSIFALSLEVARASAGGSSPASRDLEVLQTMADELSADVRVFLTDGRPGDAGTNLLGRLQQLTTDLGARTGALVLTDHRVDWDEYGHDFADTVVRIVSEAFRNITKHAAPSQIRFRSRRDPGTEDVVIEIADDGSTDARPRTSSSGFGLGLIRELTARWHGRVDLAVTEHGSTLTIRVVPDHQSEWAAAQRILRSGSEDD